MCKVCATSYNGIIAGTHEEKWRLQRQKLLQELCGKRSLQLFCSLKERVVEETRMKIARERVRERQREGERKEEQGKKQIEN